MVHHRPGEHLKDADALSRLAVIPDHKNVNATLLWEGTEELKFHIEKFTVPETMVPRILELYHDTPHSGGHDGFWRTYHKIRQRFQWKHMKEDVQRCARSCHQCQVHKAKYHQKIDEMVLPQNSDAPFAVIHLDFTELKKKAAGVRRTQSFLVATDQCTRIVAARPRREDANSVIVLLSREMFKNMKIVISDNGPAFLSRRLQDWAKERGVVLRRCAPYHPAGNGMAERIIRDLKQFISMYPGFQGG